MHPTIVRNFGEPDVPPHVEPWSEQKDVESGASPTTTTQMMIENIWRPNGENIALSSAINQSAVPTLDDDTFRATYASPRPVPFGASSCACSTPLPSPGRILKTPAAPKKKPVIIAKKKTRSMTLLDSATQTLATLKLSLQDEVKELEMILQDVLPSSEMGGPLPTSRYTTPTLLSSTTRDSLPTNNLFAQSPVYATKEAYFQHCGCSGSTDPLAPERLALRLKRQETRQSTLNHQETNGGMDTEESL
ncbi:MAG: hypothetical protein [Circoviridae sp.]|nr:MAG: hypothetical protein [Circoviridae sp.]